MTAAASARSTSRRADLAQPALSPDGRRLLYLQVEKGQGSIYLHDLESGATQRISTTSGYSEQPSWARDGRTMFYEGNTEGSRVLYRMALDSGAQATLIAKGNFSGGFESADGRFMIYTVSNPTTGLDVVALPLVGSGTPVALAASSDERSMWPRSRTMADG